VDVARLSDAVRSVEGLFLLFIQVLSLGMRSREKMHAYLHGGVPPHIDEDDMVARRQVESFKS
jgi:hypothetical protein